MTKSRSDENLIQRYRRDKYALLIIWVATIIFLGGMALLLYTRETYLQSLLARSTPSITPVGFWASVGHTFGSVAENLLCGIALSFCVAGALKFLHFDGAPPPDSKTQTFINSGILRLLAHWHSDIPEQAALCELFRKSKVVEMYGLSFYNALVDAPDFPALLWERLRDKSKETRILLLDPDGAELKRRDALEAGRDLIGRAKSTHKVLSEVVSSSGEVGFYFTFDYAPAFAMLRFDSRAYINLQLIRVSGSSPGLELRKGAGWLFPYYNCEFEFAWKKASESNQ